jgi:hypothetical protein
MVGLGDSVCDGAPMAQPATRTSVVVNFSADQRAAGVVSTAIVENTAIHSPGRG